MDIRKFMKKSPNSKATASSSRRSLASSQSLSEQQNKKQHTDNDYNPEEEEDDDQDFQINRKRSTRSRRSTRSTKAIDLQDDEPNEMDIDTVTETKPTKKKSTKRTRAQQQEKQNDQHVAPSTGFGGPSEQPEDEDDNPPPKPPPKKPRWMPRTDDPPNRGSKPLPVGAPDCLQGKVFIVTGVLDSLLRDECTDLCKEYGARVVGSVSKKVTHAIVGTEPGASKMTKLKTYKTPIIDEDQLFEMINSSMPDEKQPKEEKKIEKEAVKMETDEIKPAPKRVSSSRKKETKQEPKTTKQKGIKSTSKSSSPVHSLWVDKYKPLKATDLVANPKAIKDLKNWLINWKSKFLHGNAHSLKSRERGDQDYAAALLIGAPGIGKTSAAHIVCREAGFEPHEFNASDVRNKGGIASLADTAMIANTIGKYLSFDSAKGKKSNTFPEGQVLIMDEVDGMSGGDRGGSQELIKLIKKTKVPIICIANDDTTSNMRSLAGNCFKLRFRRPMTTQVSKRLMEIARREGFHAMQDQALQKLAEGCNGDIRQMINLLQSWRTESADLSFADVKKRMTNEGKTNVQKSIFDLARTFFSPGIDGSPNSLFARADNYFADSDLVPLFVQENYPHTTAATMSLEALADAAESISEGDLCSTMVRRSQRWDLMPSASIMSAIRPGTLLAGGLAAQLRFPAFLGNMSKGNKWRRIVQGLEMKVRATHTSSGSNEAFRLDYIPTLTTTLATPLIRDGAVGIDDVVERLDAYYLERDPDWTEILEAGVFSKGRSPLECIKKPVLTAFTKEYNTRMHQRSAVTGARIGAKATTTEIKKSSTAGAEDVAVVDDDDDDDASSDKDVSEEEDVTKMFGVKSKQKGKRAKATNSSAKGTKKKTTASSGRGKSGARGRGRGRSRGR